MADARHPDEALLRMQARSSFPVGGGAVEQSYVELGSQRAGNHVTVDPRYVEYMGTVGPAKVPVVLIHRAGQTRAGAGFDTTPGGRMGWSE